MGSCVRSREQGLLCCSASTAQKPVRRRTTPTATAAAAAVRDSTMRVRTVFLRRASTREGFREFGCGSCL